MPTASETARPRWRGYRQAAVAPEAVADRYDAVVIGAGIGGLVCATHLAAAGASVLAVEANALPGGLCSFYKRKGFHFDAGAHYFGALGQERSFVGLLLRPLGLPLPLLPQDPVEVVHFPDATISLPANYFDCITRLQDLFPAERQAIAGFFDELLRVYRHQYRGKDSPLLAAYRAESFQHTLDRHFQAPRLKAVLGAAVGYIGLRPAATSAAAMAAMLMSYHYDGGYLAEGGSQSLADALMWRFADLGGHLCLGTRVTRIAIEAGRATGVELEGGRHVRAGAVVSNADVRHTVSTLIGPGVLPEDYVTRVATERESHSLNVLYLGVAIDDEPLRGLRGWHWTSEDLNAPTSRFRYVATPTLADRSLAPAGHHVVTVTEACTEPVAADADLYDDAWTDRRRAFADQALDWLDAQVPGIATRVIVREAATRRTVHHYTGNSRGAVYGWSTAPGQFGADRLPQDTPIDRLFLCGHWTQPGPGIASVAVSGALAARRAAAVLGCQA